MLAAFSCLGIWPERASYAVHVQAVPAPGADTKRRPAPRDRGAGRVREAYRPHRSSRYALAPRCFSQSPDPSTQPDRRLHGGRPHEHRRHRPRGCGLERQRRQDYRDELDRRPALWALHGHRGHRYGEGRRQGEPGRSRRHGRSARDPGTRDDRDRRPSLGGATVSATGLVTGVTVCSATITATSEGKNGTATVTVTAVAVPVASVAVNPPTPSVAVGGTVQLTATPQDSAGNSLPGRTVTWASSAGAASVSTTGLG